FAKAVYAAYFVEGKDISEPEVVADIAAGVGAERTAFLAAVQDAEIKEAFKKSVEEIVFERKVFGAPFFIVDGQSFWGADRVGQLDEWLTTGGW
ncbi:MAG: 2-hydroxychromene-2-carboxylate isomerase, partial [Sneathiella sp.]|uniref:DsbA family protein n=1 Tax=Sneathiella sp. TaxID=1964365 RepID=UPI000C474682